MSAYEELRASGTLGPDGALLLYKVTRIVAVGRGFPPHEGYDEWTADAVKEAAHEFMVHERTPKRLAWMLSNTQDDQSMERALVRIVHNYFRDLGRATELGRLIRRIDTVLNDADEFVLDDRLWRLQEDGLSTPSNVPPRDLRAAAERVTTITVPRWSQNARRSAPHADAASIRRLAEAILVAASGSLETVEIARAMAPRLGVSEAPAADILDYPEPTDTRHSATVEAGVERQTAREVFEQLTEDERKAMAAAHLPLREVYEAVGLHRSRAGEVRQRAVSIVKEMTEGLPDPSAVRLHLLDMAQVWLERTQEADGTS